MNENTKKVVYGALTLLTIALGVITAQIVLIRDEFAPSPSPLPSPSFTVVPSPSAIPSPTPVPSPSSGGLHLVAARGEVVSFEVDPLSMGLSAPCVQNLAPLYPATVQCFDEHTINVATPSAIGLATGAVVDPLVPVQAVTSKRVWVDLAVSRSAAPGLYPARIGGKDVVLEVVQFMTPEKPSVPFYVEVQARQIYFSHGLNENSTTLVHSTIVKKYLAMLRAHRIEPVKQAMSGLYPALKSDGTLDLDYLSAVGASHRELFLTGNIAPPMIFGPANTIPPSVVVLKAIEGAIKSGALPVDTYAWVWDEGWRSLDAETLARIQLIKTHAPSLKVMLTRFDEAPFRPYTDLFIQNVDAFQRPGWPSELVKPYGLYGSCMSQGKCYNGSPVARTGTPLMVLDAPRIDARAYIWVMEKLGAKAGLYFNSTQMLTSAWTDQMNEGGNGDGTLFYPGNAGTRGLSSEQPIASLRLKQLRRGLFDLEILRASRSRGLPFPNLVTDAFIWEKDEAKYEALRAQLLRQL